MIIITIILVIISICNTNYEKTTCNTNRDKTSMVGIQRKEQVIMTLRIQNIITKKVEYVWNKVDVKFPWQTSGGPEEVV